MKNNNHYQGTIQVDVPLQTAFEGVQRRVSEWWTANLEGSTQTAGDSFTVRFGNTFVTFTIAELVSPRRIVWLVTDCYLHSLTNKTEWLHTVVIWEFAENKGFSEITMTHVGLVPGIECYEMCNAGWNKHFKGSLHRLLTEVPAHTGS